jgi:hypothetical protein
VKKIEKIERKRDAILTSISEGIAAMFLRDAIRKGYGIEIPSLGIKIEGPIEENKRATPGKLPKLPVE